MRAPSHPALDDLRAFGDGEAPPAEAARTAAHLEGCTECRARLTRLRALREEIREATTLSPPPQTWERIVARRAAGEELILPVADAARAERSAAPSVPRRIPLRRAAVLLLGVAGIASATVPGSPVRDWLRGLLAAEGGGASAPSTRPAAAPADSSPAAPGPDAAPLPADAPTAGIGVEPADGEVRVAISRPGAALRIRVRLGEGTVAQVSGRGAAADAGFASGRGRITVTDPRAGELEVVLPRSARRATLSVDGTRFVLLEEGRMTVLVPADSSGAELLFPGRP